MNSKVNAGAVAKISEQIVFHVLFVSDLEEKMSLASWKRERNKYKAAPCEADNLFSLFTACPSSRRRLKELTS